MSSQVNTIKIQVGDETREFVTREIVSPAIYSFFKAELAQYDVTDESFASQFLDSVIADSKKTNYMARVLLRGNHEGLNWFLDGNVEFLLDAVTTALPVLAEMMIVSKRAIPGGAQN